MVIDNKGRNILRFEPVIILITILAIVGCDATDNESGDHVTLLGQSDSPVPIFCADENARLVSNRYSPYHGGEEEVRVEVNIFDDFHCPYCSKYYFYIKQLWESREDFNKYARVYFHHFPISNLHPDSEQIHIAAAAVASQGNAYFWQLREAVAQQFVDTSKRITFDDVLALVNSMNLKTSQFEADVASQETADFVKNDMDEALQAGVNGTPTVFVCGKEIQSRRQVGWAVNYLLEGNSW